VAALLPDRPITVVTMSIVSALTQLFTSVLADRVPEFRDRVGAGPLVAFPVQSDTNRSIVIASNGVAAELSATPYSFAFWVYYDIILVPHPYMHTDAHTRTYAHTTH
jgi:ABC-type phosphate transport system substrate-binding protein